MPLYYQASGDIMVDDRVILGCVYFVTRDGCSAHIPYKHIPLTNHGPVRLQSLPSKPEASP